MNRLDPPWKSCSQLLDNAQPCKGAAVSGGRCLAHLGRIRCFRHLMAVKAFAQILDGRGVKFTNERLELVLKAFRDENGRATIPRLDFTLAAFGDGTRFSDVTFGVGTRFDSMARFSGAPFGDETWFDDATFGDRASFAGATFGDGARFSEATFGDETWFDSATFGDEASFAGATFGDETWFDYATFGYGASFDGATFGDEASFDGATFGNGARLASATFEDGIRFAGAQLGAEPAPGHRPRQSLRPGDPNYWVTGRPGNVRQRPGPEPGHHPRPSIAQMYETTVIDRGSGFAAFFVVVPAAQLPSAAVVYPNTPVDEPVKFLAQALQLKVVTPPIANTDIPTAVVRLLQFAQSKAVGGREPGDEVRRASDGPLMVADMDFEPPERFVEHLVEGQVVPFQESPLRVASIAELLTAAESAGVGAAAFLATFHGEPLLLAALPGGLILLRAARGVGQALNIGLRYHVLKLMRVPPENWGEFAPEPDDES